MNHISNNQQETSHLLYSKGYVFDDFDSLKKISTVMSQTQLEVQEKVLC